MLCLLSALSCVGSGTLHGACFECGRGMRALIWPGLYSCQGRRWCCWCSSGHRVREKPLPRQKTERVILFPVTRSSPPRGYTVPASACCCSRFRQHFSIIQHVGMAHKHRQNTLKTALARVLRAVSRRKGVIATAPTPLTTTSKHPKTGHTMQPYSERNVRNVPTPTQEGSNTRTDVRRGVPRVGTMKFDETSDS
jgi:hypothetical protein